ncbi:DUF6695 family protein [uncultured Dokdonia sp.]|uniref:DUF6695 family protein n=1 Tax=uncultured Dokdonia sp. TaxID=575653 RepID=UPI00263654F1|nr:DUF6695 family protein [uncultured Dokdonia sp.]
MRYNGKIIVLAFPDTFVKMSDELMCKILPLVGLGTRTHIKAGHAALVLIENATGNALYYDFGRYVTPEGSGRVRGANTDAELEIPFKAIIKNNILENLDEFLLWLNAHPEKTHGSGRLVASLNEHVYFEKAYEYIEKLQEQGSIPYRAFGNLGSNCARFVTETILACTEERHIIKALKHNKKFTPSTVGNVEKSASDKVYQVHNGAIYDYNSTALRENLTNYFDKKVPETYLQDGKDDIILPEGAQLLTGIGCGAWFYLEKTTKNQVLITRYTEAGIPDCKGIAEIPLGFDITQKYRFVYDSNCSYCTIQQAEKTYRFDLIRKPMVSNLAQREHLA